MKINVLVFTYCQQQYIKRALDSVLSQNKEVLNKIIIVDDHSTDNTWEVIQQYKSQYPDIIESHRNDVNLGIYGNMNKVITLRGNADLYYTLAGDDAICKGWFDAVKVFVENNSIDLDGPIGIFSRWKFVNPEGVESVLESNDAANIIKGKVLGSALRGKLTMRSLLVSKNVMDQVTPIITDKGIAFAEFTYGAQIMKLIEIPYFLDYVGSIYYSGIGVARNIEKYDPGYYTDSSREAYEFIINNYVKVKVDEYYMKSKINAINFITNHNPIALFNSLWQYVLSAKGYGLNYKEMIEYYKFIIRKAYRNRWPKKDS